MQVDAPCFLQDTVHHKQSFRHVGGIGEHLALRNESFKPSNHLGRGVSNSVLDARYAFRRFIVPKPDIIKRLDLWVDTESGIFENLVVFLVGVERRIEADQVDMVVGKA